MCHFVPLMSRLGPWNEYFALLRLHFPLTCNKLIDLDWDDTSAEVSAQLISFCFVSPQRTRELELIFPLRWVLVYLRLIITPWYTDTLCRHGNLFLMWTLSFPGWLDLPAFLFRTCNTSKNQREEQQTWTVWRGRPSLHYPFSPLDKGLWSQPTQFVKCCLSHTHQQVVGAVAQQPL